MIVTKGMGSNRVVGEGYGYQFSYGQLVIQSGGGGSGGGRRYRRSYAQRIDTLHMSRRPRMDGPVVLEHESIKPVDLQPVQVEPPEAEQPAIHHRVDTGTKVVCVVSLGLAFIGVALL